jgi:molecular chaperone HtpG
MLSEDKFFDKAKKFALYPTVADTYFTFDELIEKTKDSQTDKEGNQVILYTSNKEAQHSYIQEATAKGYEVLLLDSPIISHLMQKLEGAGEKVKFSRVDADHIDNIIKKEDNVISKLSDTEKEALKPIIEAAVPTKTYTVQLEAMDSASSPFMITVPEFMRRMKEMQASGGGGGMMGMGNFPDMYNLVVNTNSPLVSEILNNKDEAAQKGLISQAFDLAKLSQNLLHGEDLTNFIKRSYELIK